MASSSSNRSDLPRRRRKLSSQRSNKVSNSIVISVTTVASLANRKLNLLQTHFLPTITEMLTTPRRVRFNLQATTILITQRSI
jgi:hypothetical protein